MNTERHAAARIVGGDAPFRTTDTVKKQADVNGDTKEITD